MEYLQTAWSWIMARLREPSTYAGAAAIVAASGQIWDIAEAPAIADGLNQVAASGGGTAALVTIGAGTLAVILRDKGQGR